MKTPNLEITAPPKKAVGLKAIQNSIRHIRQAMGLGKGMILLSKLNQQGGIDCPGCAWPDPKERSRLGEFCENGAKAIAEEAMNQRANEGFFHQYNTLQLLERSDYWLGQQGRLTHPMMIRKGEGHYQPIAWKEAFELIGNSLNNLESPDEAVFYTSGRTSNEAAFLYQLFVRMYGTNNLPDCSNMCHESSGAALTETVGIGKGSVTLEDFNKAELILIFGQNPATNHPRMLTSLEKAKQHGAKIVSINPLKEVGLVHFNNPQSAKGLLGIGTALSDLYLQVKINEDVALLKAVMKKLLLLAVEKPYILDQEFIQNKTAGYKELVADLDQYDLPDLIARTGLSEESIDELVILIAQRKRIIACWAMGLTQHQNGVDNIREVVNLLLLKGSIGKEGAGTCPVRGHSNVQGDRTMGIIERPSKALLDKISENFGFEPPTSHGYSVIEAIEAMYERKAKVFMGLGGNFVPAAPDTAYTSQALQNCQLTVHVSTKLNRSHLIHGDIGLILPCLGRTEKHISKGKEQVITVENSMGVVHTSTGVLRPASKHLLPEPYMIAQIAQATLAPSKVDWEGLVEDYGCIRDLIEQTISGFEDYNKRVAKDNGFELPNGARIGVFNTPNKKANFSINQLSSIVCEEGELLMMTMRSHDQFNTTIYGLDDRYRGIFNGRKVIFMNETDAKERGLANESLVDIFNQYDDTLRKVYGFKVVYYEIPKGCVATYFPEANPLVPINVFAHTSLTPASKSIKVKIEKAV